MFAASGDEQANAPNTGHDTILFSSGVVAISPSSELPTLTNTNGATIYSDHTLFILGTSLPGGGDGLTLASNNNNVMGLVIAGFDNGVVVTGHYNVIGTDGDGLNDTAEKNVIYSNDDGTGYGIQLSGNNNVVAGNYLGLSTNGEDIGANTTGIWVSGNDNRIGTDGNGTSDSLERNVISGNTQHGIDISGDNNVVAGNYIGINGKVTRQKRMAQTGIDIDLLAANTRIGTDSNGVGDTAERNIISGNGDNGIKTKVIMSALLVIIWVRMPRVPVRFPTVDTVWPSTPVPMKRSLERMGTAAATVLKAIPFPGTLPAGWKLLAISMIPKLPATRLARTPAEERGIGQSRRRYLRGRSG